MTKANYQVRPHLDLNTKQGQRAYDRQLRYLKRKEARQARKRMLATGRKAVLERIVPAPIYWVKPTK